MSDPENNQITQTATDVLDDVASRPEAKPRVKMRDECRYCGCKRGESGEWYDEEYCSGKCKKLDGGEIVSGAKHIKATGGASSLDDYLLDYPKKLGEKDAMGQRIKGRQPKRYRRRHDPERLNWGEPLTRAQLIQAGLRANREPIPGDWDYKEGGDENGS